MCEHSAFVLAHNYVFCDKMAHFGRIVKPLCGAFWRWLGCFLLRTDFRRLGFGAAGKFSQHCMVVHKAEWGNLI